MLTQARRRNTELAITGILFYANERFVQLLEGEEQAVRALYELIKADPRHHSVIAFSDKPTSQRTFTQWAMAFQPSSPQQVAELAGYLGAPDVAVELAGLSPVDKDLFDLLRSFTLP